MEDLTVKQLWLVQLSLITRERVIREQWEPSVQDQDTKKELLAEADDLQILQRKFCAAKLSKELGFHVEPGADPIQAFQQCQSQ